MTLQLLPDNWRKSARSDNDTGCVEVANNSELTLVRDTKDRRGGHLAVPAAAWQAFIERL